MASIKSEKKESPKLGSLIKSSLDNLTPMQNEVDIIVTDFIIDGYPIRSIVIIQRLVRRFIQRKIFRDAVLSYPKLDASLSPRNRRKALQEMYTSELSYISALQTLETCYRVPMEKYALQFPLHHHNFAFTVNSIQCIFSNLTALLELSKKILAEVEYRITNWVHSQMIGDVFLSLTPFLRIYGEFVNNHEKAIKCLREILTTPKGADFVKLCKVNSACGLEIFDLLIMPIQRLPRYELLLKELMKYTEPGHVDYENLQQAISAIEKLNRFINHHKRMTDGFIKMATLRTILKGFPDLIKISRFYLNEGVLHESDTIKENEGDFYYFLFNDIFIATKEKKPFFVASKMGLMHKTFQYHHGLYFTPNTQIQDFNDTTFLIIDSARTFTFTTNTIREKRAWLDFFKVILQVKST